MPRHPRLDVAGALYHVISRGNARQKIFLSTGDFQRYLSYLAHYQQRDRFRVFAYVLMPNHVHLLIETSDVPLSRTMQRLNSRYSLVFNRVHRRVGHVLQGRYHALLCEKDAYLVTLTRYLHLNPVRAKMVSEPGDYPWSSYDNERLGVRSWILTSRSERAQSNGHGSTAAYRVPWRRLPRHQPGQRTQTHLQD